MHKTAHNSVLIDVQGRISGLKYVIEGAFEHQGIASGQTETSNQ